MNPTLTKEPQPQSSYLDDRRAFPFCKGCGHTTVLRKLNEALVSLQVPPEQTVLVTDIGCIGLADMMFRDIHTVHTTHGRSTAFATGIALADSVLADNKLTIIVLIGDGGAMIGLQHLVHAAMLNVDITVLVCNNFVYGMTGGQGSGLTPECFVTSTTPHGNIVPPADLCEILKHSNAPFVERTISTNRALAGTIREAIELPGCSVVEILELCTEHVVPKNELKGSSLGDIAGRNGWQMGTIVRRQDRKPYYMKTDSLSGSDRTPARKSMIPQSTRLQTLHHAMGIVVAGSAGERVQSSAALFCTMALRRGLYATQKNDNPVTQGTGFSMSEIRISPGPIGYTGIEHPDILLILSEDGVREAVSAGWFARIDATTEVYVDETVGAGLNGPGIRRLPIRRIFGAGSAALGSLLWLCAKKKMAGRSDFIDELRMAYGEETAEKTSRAYDAFLQWEAVR